VLAVVEACTIVAALFRGNAPRRDVAATEPASFRKFRSGRKHPSSRCRPERAVGEFRSSPLSRTGSTQMPTASPGAAVPTLVTFHSATVSRQVSPTYRSREKGIVSEPPSP
jgi:hypothetical protein